MAQLELRRVCCHLLLLLLFLVIELKDHSSNAQQLYNGDSYVCSDSGQTSCGAFALYRAQTGYANLTSIGTLFNTDPSGLATLNKWPVYATLATGQPLIIPLNCICFNQTSYANLTYIIQSGDTFYDVNLNAFESLSTTQAVIDANPTADYYDLTIGEPIVFPVRGACPSVAQLNANVTNLITYPVVDGDSISQIAGRFGVSTDALVNANTLGGADAVLSPETTLLIPINSLTYFSPTVSSPASAPETEPAPEPTSGGP